MSIVKLHKYWAIKLFKLLIDFWLKKCYNIILKQITRVWSGDARVAPLL